MLRKNSILLLIFTLGFILLTLLVSFVDKSVFMETGKEIGLFSVNKISNNFSYNKTLDLLSDILLLISISSIIFFIIVGAYQLFKRKRILKVDKEIISYGITLVIMAILWVVFEKLIVINYRPILVEGKLEASYPSTHILITGYSCISFAYLISKYLKNKKIINVIYLLSFIIIIAAFILRLICKMHWLTDCLSSLLLVGVLFFLNKIINSLLNKIY